MTILIPEADLVAEGSEKQAGESGFLNNVSSCFFTLNISPIISPSYTLIHATYDYSMLP